MLQRECHGPEPYADLHEVTQLLADPSLVEDVPYLFGGMANG